MATLLSRSFDTPDEVRTPPKAHIDVLSINGKQIMRATFEPGWRWSEHIKPTAGTGSCQMHHFGYQTSGRMHVVGDDGTEMEIVAGKVADIPPGHDAWVVGDEPVVFVDFGDVSKYAK